MKIVITIIFILLAEKGISQQITYKDLIGTWIMQEDKKIAFPSGLTLMFHDSVNVFITTSTLNSNIEVCTYSLDTIGRFTRFHLKCKIDRNSMTDRYYLLKFINDTTLKIQINVIYEEGKPEYEKGFRNAPIFVRNKL
jgi:hypothetical protein